MAMWQNIADALRVAITRGDYPPGSTIPKETELMATHGAGRETVRRCGLMWGVRAASMRRHETTEELIADAARRVVELGWCERGQRVGITAGLPSGRPGTTSLVQIQVL